MENQTHSTIVVVDISSWASGKAFLQTVLFQQMIQLVL